LVWEKFEARLIEVIAHDFYVLRMGHLLTDKLKYKFRVVFYEELLGLEDEFENLLRWLGFDIYEFEFQDEFDGKCDLNCTKNTSDDLRNSIANYEEFESWLESRYPCLV